MTLTSGMTSVWPAPPRRRSRWLALGLLLALSACATPEPAPAPPPAALADLLQRPAERALHEALRAYDDAQYAAAEAALQTALREGLRNPRDQALAHKLVAFITCTSERIAACEAAFRAARAADPSFTLSRAESGHPLWGPVFVRVQQP